LTLEQIILFAVLGLVFALLIWGRWRYDTASPPSLKFFIKELPLPVFSAIAKLIAAR